MSDTTTTITTHPPTDDRRPPSLLSYALHARVLAGLTGRDDLVADLDVLTAAIAATGDHRSPARCEAIRRRCLVAQHTAAAAVNQDVARRRFPLQDDWLRAGRLAAVMDDMATIMEALDR